MTENFKCPKCGSEHGTEYAVWNCVEDVVICGDEYEEGCGWEGPKEQCALKPNQCSLKFECAHPEEKCLHHKTTDVYYDSCDYRFKGLCHSTDAQVDAMKTRMKQLKGDDDATNS